MKTGAQKWWALGALTLAVLAVGLDGTVLSVALPTLAKALKATESDLQWFFSGYLLTLAAAMLPMGLLGDRFGRKKVLLISLALFGAGSVVCAYASNPQVFMAARAVLGVAGAGITVMALSALTVMFTPEERPRAVGVWAAANFLALPIGPILGGWLLAHYWWGWVFLLNGPVALIGLIVGLALLPESRAPGRLGLDLLGILLSTAGLVALTYGLIEAGQNGWGDNSAVWPMVGGLVGLILFFLWEGWLGRRPNGQPLVNLRLFRSRAFTWGVVLAALAGLSMIGALFTLPQFFQDVNGADTMASGLRLLPLIGGLVVGAIPADRVAKLIGVKITVALGFLVMGGALLLGSTTSASSSVGFVALWMALIGVGLGLAMSTATSTALTELSEKDAGIGSSVLQALQKTGAPFGAAALGSVLSSAYLAKLDVTGLSPALASLVKQGVAGGVAVADAMAPHFPAQSAALLDSVRSAFVYGMDVSLAVAAGIAGVSMLIALIFLPMRRASARPAASAVPASGASVQNQEQPLGISG
jgi:EmrB/QacA subfamily drug resistance transporter